MTEHISLAVKYRPKTWDDIIEQDAIKFILQEQLRTGTFKQVYLFSGPSGDGKTTTARIFANSINKGGGNLIEMDAASHNGVDDVREISQQAKTQSMDSEYKIFLLDEVHSFSNNAWQAMLKLIEEPPEKTIFLFCTTDPQKIPKTILGRVQRYNFSRISQQGIVKRLDYICVEEYHGTDFEFLDEYTQALEYIAKLSDGGMRDAISMMDKCLSYSTKLTLENVVKALGIANYDIMFSLFDSISNKDTGLMLEHIDSIYGSGVDIKQFIRSFTEFILDINKYRISRDFKIVKIPNNYQQIIDDYTDAKYDDAQDLLTMLVKLNSEIKWDANPKALIEANLMMYLCGE